MAAGTARRVSGSGGRGRGRRRRRRRRKKAGPGPARLASGNSPDVASGGPAVTAEGGTCRAVPAPRPGRAWPRGVAHGRARPGRHGSGPRSRRRSPAKLPSYGCVAQKPALLCRSVEAAAGFQQRWLSPGPHSRTAGGAAGGRWGRRHHQAAVPPRWLQQ